MIRLVVLLLLCFASTAWGGVSVSERVFVVSERLTLADLIPDSPGQYSEVSLGASPKPGGKRTLKAEWIRHRARLGGVELAEVELPDRVMVTRKGVSPKREDLEAAVVDALRKTKVRGQVFVSKVRLPRTVPAGRVEYDVKLPEGELCSPATLKVDFYVDGALAGRGWARVEFGGTERLVTLARELKRDDIVESGDLAIVEGRPKRTAMLDPADAIGKRIVRTLAAGATLSKRDLKAVPVVVKGDLVTLVARIGTITATARGVALGKGGVGERLKVENTNSGRIVQGTVRGAGLVDITAAEGRL